MTANETTDDQQSRAESQIVDLVRALCNAARDGRAHMSHEGGSLCIGCRAVRSGLAFVEGMTSEETPDEMVQFENK